MATASSGLSLRIAELASSLMWRSLLRMAPYMRTTSLRQP
jgi:hypothetical protein